MLSIVNKSALIVLIQIVITSICSSQSIWEENSFEDFRDGKFTDAGSNCYVSAKGRMQMITKWDFNNDGFLDIFLPGSQTHTEKENIFIYLNNGEDIDARSRIELPAAGASDGLIADFNKDGYNDLAVVHYSDSHFKRVAVWIYIGSENGYSVENRIELPSAEGSAIAAGDFNNDSWLDIAVACQYWYETEDINLEPRKSFIYWNSDKGFKPENNLPISINNRGLSRLAVGDLDNDNIDDLVAITKEDTYLLLSSRNAFNNLNDIIRLDIKSKAASIGDVNNDGFADLALCTSGGVVLINGVYKGKLSKENQRLLSVSTPEDIKLCDLNLDGLDDIVVANFSTKGGATWTDSYVYFSDGSDFTDENILRLPTLGAKAVNCADLNGDGYPEIVFSFFRVTNQKNLLSYIYWNDKGTFRFGDHTQLPTLGTMANALGDVNGDGLTDVVFFNDEGYFRDGPLESPIYWGDGTRNFDPLRKYVFQTHQIFGFGHADLDDDNNVDMILAQNNFISGLDHEQNGLIIQWGNKGDFGPPTHLTSQAAYGGVRVADINKDGYLDLLGGGYCIDLEKPDKHGFPIFWGSRNGYSFRNRSLLHYTGARFRAPLLMDLNNDDWLDIAGQVEDGKVRIWWGAADGFKDEVFTDIDLGRKDHLMYIKGADFNKDGWIDLLFPQRGSPDGTETSSFIYYGSPDGYSNDNRTKVNSFVPYQNSIADLNKDGWLDLFLTAYGGEVNGNRPSMIYWGSEKGFSETATELESYGSSGSETLDYDGDGWLDILICNHRRAGSYLTAEPHRHITPSQIYWGSENGYSKENRWEILANGPSGLNLRDLGNSLDRGLYEDYISSVYEIEDNQSPSFISWDAETPFNTEVRFQLKISDNKEDLANEDWFGENGVDSWFTHSGSKITNLEGKYIQYRARLITSNGAASPYLTGVKILFQKS